MCESWGSRPFLCSTQKAWREHRRRITPVSIKVYEAFRVARGVDPFPLLWEIKRRGQAEAKARLARVFRDVLDGHAQRSIERHEVEDLAFKAWIEAKGLQANPDEIFGLYIRWCDSDRPVEFRQPISTTISVSNKEILQTLKRDAAEGDRPGVFDVDRWAHTMYGKQLATLTRNQWALDVAITLRCHRGRHYLIPYCESSSLVGGTLDFMAQHEHLEDFAYWNNTDRPDSVTSSQWAWRARVWNHFTQHDRWPEYLSLDIVSWQGWSAVSPVFELLREYGGVASRKDPS